MPIKSIVQPAPKAGSPFPKLMEHVPTGCIILFIDAVEGWLVGDPHMAAARSIGHRWACCNQKNYRDFRGHVVLGDV